MGIKANNGYIITWMLHQILLSEIRSKLKKDFPIYPFPPSVWTNWPIIEFHIRSFFVNCHNIYVYSMYYISLMIYICFFSVALAPVPEDQTLRRTRTRVSPPCPRPPLCPQWRGGRGAQPPDRTTEQHPGPGISNQRRISISPQVKLLSFQWDCCKPKMSRPLF